MTKKLLKFLCVHYGNDESFLIAQICKYFGASESDIYFVDTSNPNKYGTDVNSFFEFSGYKVGTDNIINDLRFENLDSLEVVYLNDTIFTSHLTQLYSTYFSMYKRAPNKRFGLYGMGEFRSHGYMIPSCFFIISSPIVQLSNVEFHPKNNLMKLSSIKRMYVGKRTEFNKEIDDWLYPKNFFKGWYKASPFKKISNEIYIRKRLAIYLEYTLPTRVCRANLDLEVRVNRRVNFIRFLDRLYCNLVKIRYRISTVVNHV